MPDSGYGVSPFDERIAELVPHGPLKPFHTLPLPDQTKHLQEYYAFLKSEALKQDSGMNWKKKLAGLLPEPVREKVKWLFM